jgi:predicted Zn-dependent peptidase
MFFKGTKNRSYKDICEDGALMGSIQNAFTSTYPVKYHLTVPYSNTGKAIELLLDMFFNSTFPEQEIEKEIDVVLEEMSMYEDNHGAYFNSQMSQALFEPLAGHPVIGYRETVKGITRDRLVAFKERIYGVDNTYIIVVGPESPDKYLEEFSSYYAGFDTVSNNPDIPKHLLNDNKDFKITRENIQQTHIDALVECPGIESLEARHKCALSALGGGMYSLLFQEVREEKGLCYGVGAGLSIQNVDCGVISLWTLTEKGDEAKETMTDVLNKALTQGIPEKTFECAKADLMSSVARGLETSNSIAATTLRRILFDLDLDLEKRFSDYEDVTLADVNQGLKELFEDKELVWARMDPK